MVNYFPFYTNEAKAYRRLSRAFKSKKCDSESWHEISSLLYMPNENEGLCKLDKSRLCKSIKMTLQIIPENLILSNKNHKRVSINNSLT